MKLETRYQLENGVFNEIGLLPANLTKVTVFALTPSNTDKPFQPFVDLAQSFICDHKLYSVFRASESVVLWDIYLSPDLVNPFLTGSLQPSGFDYLVWPTSGQPPKLLVFDMDSTFIEIEVIDELAKRHGVGEAVSKVTELAMRGELDFSESLVSRVACLQGLSEQAIDEICLSLPLSQGVSTLVQCCHAAQVKIAIVSGGFTPFVGFLKKTMDLYRVHANRLELSDGKLTGRVIGDIVDAKAKADFVDQLATDLKLSSDQIMTIGDGANDLEMMKHSGFSLAYRAKPAVQREASGRMNITHLNQLIDVFNWSDNKLVGQ